MQALWSVVRREGRASGSCRFTLRMFASPGFWVTFTTSDAPLTLLVLPCVETVNDGLNGRFAQLAAWKREDTGALNPPSEVSVPEICIGSHEVGLNVNPGRSIVTFTVRICRGMPSRMLGKGSEMMVPCAVCGSTRRDWRTTTTPRLNGPATAGTSTTRPWGPPP